MIADTLDVAIPYEALSVLLIILGFLLVAWIVFVIVDRIAPWEEFDQYGEPYDDEEATDD